MKKIIATIKGWFSKSPAVDDASVISRQHQEIDDLRAKLVEAQDKLAVAESKLEQANRGNRALQDFIAKRHQPDKVMPTPPRIVKPFAVIAAMTLAICAQAQFPPPYVHNYWDTNLVPVNATGLTNAASARTLTDAAGLTNGIIPSARYAGTGANSVNLGNAHAAGASTVAVGNGANASATAGSTAVGHSADAENGLATAIGDSAVANFGNDTALGYSAATTKAHQVMLGTSAEEVRAPGTLVVDGVISGNGAGITNIPSASLTNVAILNANNVFTGSNTIAGRFEGSGTLLTNLNASQLKTGLVPATQAGPLSNHSDVTISGTAPTAGNILAWSGTAWTNGAQSASGSTPTFSANFTTDGTRTNIANNAIFTNIQMTSLGLGVAASGTSGRLDVAGPGYFQNLSVSNIGNATVGLGNTNFWEIRNTNSGAIAPQVNGHTNGTFYFNKAFITQSGNMTVPGTFATVNGGITAGSGNVTMQNGGTFAANTQGSLHNISDGRWDMRKNDFATTAALIFAMDNVTKTANYTVVTLDCGRDINDSGASGAHTNTLPASLPGTHLWFTVLAAQTMSVKPAQSQDTIRYTSTLGNAGGDIYSSAIGSCIHIKCPVTNVWIIDSLVGTWSGPN